MSGLEGTTLDHYQIQRLLGHGGMADVYLAYDSASHEDVAIKVLSGNHAQYLERFRREAEAIDKLQHDHILPAFDYGDEELCHYLVMPYIANGTLHELLAEGALPPLQAANLLDQIASALQFAHDHGIIHRDIKPSNILLKNDSYVYLADFGLAKAVEGTNELTQTGVLLGTPEYMAPDLTDGPASIGTDIYALGILLYQMICGRVPFIADTPVAVYWKQVREQPRPPSSLNPRLSPAIDKVVLRALDKDPQRRYQSVQELADAFRYAVTGPVRLPNTNNFSSLSTVQQGPGRMSSTRRAMLPASKRKVSTLASIIIAGGLLLFIVVPMTYVYYMYRTQSGQTLTASASSGSATRDVQGTPQGSPQKKNTPQNQAHAALAAQSAVLASSPVLVDNFSSASLNRWTVDGSHCIFSNGGYLVNAIQANYLQACPMFNPSVANTAVEVGVSLLTGHSAGLLFRLNGDQYYDFEINSDNQFFFGRHDASSNTAYDYLVKETYSSAILPMGQKNTLLLIANGPDFKLYINGNFVAEVQDATYGSGQLALVSGTSASMTTGKASFANLTLYNLG